MTDSDQFKQKTQTHLMENTTTIFVVTIYFAIYRVSRKMILVNREKKSEIINEKSLKHQYYTFKQMHA